MVKWLLTSFSLKIKKLIVAFDPFTEKDEEKSRRHTSLVLRITEIECGTCFSEDSVSIVDARAQSFLGISQLTNFVKFQGAILELLKMDGVDDQMCSSCASGTTLDELFLGCCPLNATTPIMTGKSGGFSGTLKLSIPWKNGSLDIRKVDADIFIEPVKLIFQPRTIKWLILLWETCKNLEKDRRGHMHYKSTESVYFNSASHWHSSSPASAAISTEKVVPVCGSFASDFSSLTGQASVTEALLPGAQLISDWVPFSPKKYGKDGNEEELDFGASVDQFFECLDGIRNSQSALGSSGIWNWTCSVFSAITAASSLASGSLHVPSDQQHVETNLKAAITGISILISFHDEDWEHFCDLKGDPIKVGVNYNYLGAECRDVILVLQVCPREMKFEGAVNYIEVANYLSNENDVIEFSLRASGDNFHNRTLLMQHLQTEVQDALPPFASSIEDPDLSRQSGLVAADFLPGNSGSVDKIMLLRTSGITHCHCSVNSSSSDGCLTRPTLFSLKLPPFVFWVNFHLIIVLLDLLKEIEESVEMNSKKKRFASEALNDNNRSSYENVQRGSGPSVVALSSIDSMRCNILMPNARVILCFPFKSGEYSGGYSSWDQFIAFDFSSPSNLNMGIIQDINSNSDASSRNMCSSTARSLHLSVSCLDIYLVTASCKDDVGISSCGERRQKFSSQNIMSVTNQSGCLSVISMLWQDGPVTGPWIAKKAKFLATLGESRNRYKFMGKGYEFASVTTVKDLEDLYSQTRKEMILSSSFLLHVSLCPVRINLSSSQYKNLHCLLTQMTDGLSGVAPDALGASEESSVSQTSILVECDSVELLISPDTKDNIRSSMQNELPGSWHYLKLKIQKFELLTVSNIGGIRGANFFWLAHGEGKLWGSISGFPDQEFLLISCSNSAMKRGDGEGSNALSSRRAGSDIVHLSDPESSHTFTSITVRCGTIVAVGGRLDWLDEISSFFSLPPPEIEQAGVSSLQKEGSDGPCGASFTLKLVDIGLSYEPKKNLVASVEVLDPESSSSCAKEEMGEQYVACLLAASSLILSNTTMPDSIQSEYKFTVQDLGLLICAVSEPANIGGTYSVEHLHKIGYVKVAREALIEIILRTNCKNGLLWEVECSKSHIYLETCHDTTSGLIRLAAQLQKLFAPDMEESVVHLQTRWSNVQQAHERNIVNDDSKMFNSDSAPSTSHVHALGVGTQSKSRVVGLMDEICENAFLSKGNETCQIDSQVRISLDESLLREACNFDETPETLSHDLSFNKAVPGIGLESSQASFLQKGFFPEFIEGYCLSELRPLSELSAGKQPLSELLNCKSRILGNGDLQRGNGGWYGDAPFRIVENHIQEVRELTTSKHFVEGKIPSIDDTRLDEFGTAIGCVLLNNINVRWRMYGGSHWHDSGKNSCGRDTTVCLELALSGLEFQYDVFPVGGICISRQSLLVKDFHLYDRSRNAPWKLVLGYYCSKAHPRESSSKAFKLCLEAIRPDPLIPLEEYRLSIAFLPMLLHLHQSQLDFLISFFGAESLSSDPSTGHHQDSGGSEKAQTSNNFSRHNIVDEALLPYFQKFDIWPVLVRVDYIPRNVDLAALRGGKYVELVNLVPWKGIELQLKHVHALGVYGWSGVFEAIIGEWLEDISQNQIHKLLRGLPTIKSLIAVGAGAAKMISCPVENYKKDKRVLKGMQRGTIAFLRSISVEAVGLGVHLAAGAHDILLQAEYILTSIPPSVPWTGQSQRKTNIRFNQPNNAQEGIQQACESLSDGLGKSTSALVRTPLKRYQRGAGAGSALATAVRAVPAAAIAPASACASAVHFALLGLRNSLDREHKKESMEKYSGPTQPPE